MTIDDGDVGHRSAERGDVALEAQPCESCGTHRTDDADLYRAARPGSTAALLLFRFERLCAQCRRAMPALMEPVTSGGPWDPNPPDDLIGQA